MKLTDHAGLAAAQIPGKTIASLRYDAAMGNWVMTFTDGTHILFGAVVVERYLPDGQDWQIRGGNGDG